jgi:hypothetical protein
VLQSLDDCIYNTAVNEFLFFSKSYPQATVESAIECISEIESCIISNSNPSTITKQSIYNNMLEFNSSVVDGSSKVFDFELHDASCKHVLIGASEKNNGSLLVLCLKDIFYVPWRFKSWKYLFESFVELFDIVSDEISKTIVTDEVPTFVYTILTEAYVNLLNPFSSVSIWMGNVSQQLMNYYSEKACLKLEATSKMALPMIFSKCLSPESFKHEASKAATDKANKQLDYLTYLSGIVNLIMIQNSALLIIRKIIFFVDNASQHFVQNDDYAKFLERFCVVIYSKMKDMPKNSKIRITMMKDSVFYFEKGYFFG